MNHDGVREVNDTSIQDLLAAERAILILTKSSCGNCARYSEEIVRLQSDGKLAGIVVGKLTLDKPGSARFKQENGWIRNLPHLPYTVLYLRGTGVDAFAASKASYLAERIEENFQ